MKRLFAILWLMLFLSLPAAAQQFVTERIIAASTDCTTANSCVQATNSAGYGSAAVQVEGTFSGTLNFEGTVGGGTWVELTGLTSAGSAATGTVDTAGVWFLQVPGLSGVRVRCSAYTSGAAVTSIRFAPAGNPASSVSGSVNLRDGAGTAVDSTLVGSSQALDTVLRDSSGNQVTFETRTNQGYAYAASNGTTDVPLITHTDGLKTAIGFISIVNTSTTAGYEIKLCDGACGVANFITLPALKAEASSFGGSIIPLPTEFLGTVATDIKFVCTTDCTTVVHVSVLYNKVP